MPSLITPLLEQARAAIAQHQPDQALAPLLRAWRAVPNPALGDLVEQLSGQLAAERPPLAGITRGEIEASWRERATGADAIELGVLLPSLADADSHQARKRLKLIARHAPDPRIASALTSVVLHPPFTASSTAKFWQTLHELLCACPDPRALARLEAAPALDPKAPTTLERLDARRRRSVESVRVQLEGLPSGLDVDELARIEQLSVALAEAEAAQRDLGPELLAAIVEAPGDLQRRAVYADYLLSIGDPRGEFIALQLAEDRGELDRAGKARARALLSQNQLAWLGSIDRALVRGRTSFRNGFLDVARIKHNHRGVAQLLDDPVWATVESLEHAPLALVQAPMMRSLRAIRWTAYQLVAAHREQAVLASVEALTIELSAWRRSDQGEIDPQLRQALEHSTLVPNLGRLSLEFDATMRSEQLAWLWAGPLGERLHELRLQLEGDGGPGLSGYLRSLRRARSCEAGLVRVDVEDQLLRCRFERSGASWSRVALAPGPDARVNAPTKEITTELQMLRDMDGIELVLDPLLASSDV